MNALRLNGITLAMLSLGAVAALAQPDPNNFPKGANPRAEVGQARVFAWNNQQVNTAQFTEQSVRQALGQAGFNDRALQDAVVAEATARATRRKALRGRSQKLRDAVAANALPPKQMLSLLTDFRAAVAEEKARRETDLVELDKKVGYSKNPRLEALLTTLGIVGEEAAVIGQDEAPRNNFLMRQLPEVLGWPDMVQPRLQPFNGLVIPGRDLPLGQMAMPGNGWFFPPNNMPPNWGNLPPNWQPFANNLPFNNGLVLPQAQVPGVIAPPRVIDRLEQAPPNVAFR